MGMDVFGREPTSKEGEYFRANVWYWHPLADFIVTMFPTIAAGCTNWHSNDGDGLNTTDSIALADAIDAAFAEGTVDRYIRARNKWLATLPMLECDLCHGTGLRTDAIGVEYGYDKPRDFLTNTGGCNACSGSGKTPPWDSNYVLDPDVIHEFVTFLRTSGGFKIC